MRGVRVLADCEGLYNFLYFQPSANALYVLTDRTGFIPLYQTTHDGVSWFSTSATALACLRPTRIDVMAWQCVNVAGYLLRDLSLFEGIRRVGYGVMQTLTPAKCSTDHWWRPQAQTMPGTARDIAEQYAQDQVATLGGRLRTAAPLYGTLTDGLDSRCALALLRKTLPVTKYFTGASGDSQDVDGARRLAATLGLHWDVLDDAYDDPAAFRAVLLESALTADGEQHPFSTSALWAQRLIAPGAVVLWGIGGELLRDYWSAHERARWLLAGRTRIARLVRYRMSGSFLPLAALEPTIAVDARQNVTALLEASEQAFAGFDPFDRLEALYHTERVRRWGGTLIWKTARYVIPELPLYGQRVAERVYQLPRAARRGGTLVRWVIEHCDPEVARLPHNGGYPTRPPECTSWYAKARAAALNVKKLTHKLSGRRAPESAGVRPSYRTLFAEYLEISGMRSAHLYDAHVLRPLIEAGIDQSVSPGSPLNIVVGTEAVMRAARL